MVERLLLPQLPLFCHGFLVGFVVGFLLVFCFGFLVGFVVVGLFFCFVLRFFAFVLEGVFLKTLPVGRFQTGFGKTGILKWKVHLPKLLT